MNNNIYSIIDSHMNDLVSDLQLLIRQPSVSAKNNGVLECSHLVKKIMEKAGIKTELLFPQPKNGSFKDNNFTIDPEIDRDDFLPPLIYGEVQSKGNPQGKTLLFYNHYDVQPEDPIELWENNEAFSGKVSGNYIYGRGSSDDKGELITRIKAVEYLLKSSGDVPCNIKFIVEGEEEIGSPNLERFLIQNKEKLKCDGVIWEFGYIDEKERPIIMLGLKGILYVELIAKGGPSRDVHSSLATLIENPAWILVDALKTLRDIDGKILIKNWYKEVRDFSEEELKILDKEPFDEEICKKEYGISKFLNNVKDIEAKKFYEGMPTCNISSLISGYLGKGSKTIIPNKAIAKLDFRLVPNMDPLIQFRRLCDHMQDQGFNKNILEIKLLQKEWPARTTPVDHPFVKVVEESATTIFGSTIKSISSAATGPMYYFIDILEAPCVCIGSSYKYGKSHSPNEFARIDLLNKTTKWISTIIKNFGNTKI
ncbi:MAG TPA: M20/M25/M40 family metallo-hydrolase [Nitrososphaeraceae archaeon]|nr:M20/M25/M40 family metallo-hydrolase [Nitrososphaeraceae archaeon]